MAQSGVFPIYLRAEYRGDGEGFSRFQSDAARAAAQAKREFQGVAAALDEALARPRNSVGSLDLGLDELRQAAAQQEKIAAAARQVAEATNRARAATSGYDEQLSKATQAAFRLAQAEEAKGREMLEQIEILERVQQELNQTAAATDEVIAAQRRGTTARGNVINSVRAERVAFVQLGQQLQDITIQAQAGTSGFTIFAQQVPQAAFALTGLKDSSNDTLSAVGEFATFLSGPWGAALFAATAVLGPYILSLLQVEDAAELALDATKSLAEQQENFANFFDLATGAILEQNTALIQNARLKRLETIEANQESIQQNRGRIRALIQQSDDRLLEASSVGDLSAGPSFTLGSANNDLVRALAAAGQDQKRIDAELARLARSDSSNARAAREILELRAEQVQVAREVRRLSLEAESLQTGELEEGLFKRKPKKPRREREDRSAETRQREIESLAAFAEKAANRVSEINDRFSEQTRLVTQSLQANRELDQIIDDTNRKMRLAKNLTAEQREEFEGIIKAAEGARRTIDEALVRPFEDLRRESQERLQIQELLAQGRTDEAAGLQVVLQLQRQIGTEAELQAALQRAIAEENKTEEERIRNLLVSYGALIEGARQRVIDEQRITRELRDQQAVFEAQLDVLDQVRSDLTAILSGRSTDFFGNFKQALLDLQGQRLFESIFGDAFRDIQNELQKSTPQGRANAAYVQQVERTAHATERVGNSAISLAEEFDRAFSIVRGAAEQTLTGTAANDNFSVDSITVTGDRGHTASGRRNGEVRIARPSVLDLAARISKGIGDSIAVELEDLLGARFAQTLGNIIGGFIGGKAVGGTPGGIIGALRGVLGAFADKDGKLSKTLASIDKALGGALAGTATGTQVAGLSKALGLGGSTTGAQIGGALGSFLPIPGGNIIGAVIGNFVGSLFKKTPRASATIGGVGDGLGITSLTGTNASLRNTAGDLGDSVLESINRIAQQLGADFNPSAGTVSIGQRKGNLRVDPTGRGITKVGNGAIDFGDDAEAAIAFAVRDLIQDGVITGLKQSEQNLLKAGKDVEAALADVLRFRSVFDQLDEIKDPVGFAVRSLNREFESLIDLFEKAGASAEEFASLEELYNLRRAEAIREATDRVVGSLRGLLNDLKIGDSGLSLRSRQQNALAEFNGLAARVAAGDATAFDDFADISRQLLEIERQLFGSTQSYFDRLAQVTALTEQAIADQTNVTSIGAGQPSPFDDRASIARAIEASNAEQVGWLRAINDNLIALNPNARPRSNIGGGGGGLVDGLLVNILANF